MNRLQQALKINAAIDHLYATEDAVTEIMQYNAIYDALLDIDELINAEYSEELDEEVEYTLTPAGEDIYAPDEASYKYLYGKGPITRPFGDPEPTTAFADAIDSYNMEHDIFPAVIVDPATGNLTTNFSGQGSLHPEYAVDEEFNDFSPSVGTSEGTAELQQMVGRATAQYPQPVDYIRHADGHVSIQPRRASRAPVDERVYMEFSPTKPPIYIDPVFGVASPSKLQQTISEAFEPCGAD